VSLHRCIMEVKWKWSHRSPQAKVIGIMRRDGYRVTISNYPPTIGYSEKSFFIAEISAPKKNSDEFRMHKTKREVKEIYSKFFDIKALNFGLCFDEQE